MGVAILSGPAQAQETLMTRYKTMMVVDNKGRLATDRKASLARAASGSSVPGAVMLPQNLLVKVLKRESFKQWQEKQKSSSRSKSTKYTYNVAYVEIAGGNAAGTRGWVVVGSQAKGGRSTGPALVSPPKDYAQQRRAEAVATRRSQTMPDLVVSVNSGDRTVQVAGKKVYNVSVANLGVSINEATTAVVQVGEKIVSRVKIPPLRTKGSHYFNVEISEGAIRKKKQLVVTVDADSVIKESNERNNTYSTRLR